MLKALLHFIEDCNKTVRNDHESTPHIDPSLIDPVFPEDFIKQCRDGLVIGCGQESDNGWLVSYYNANCIDVTLGYFPTEELAECVVNSLLLSNTDYKG
jgi:hypothetical protein